MIGPFERLTREQECARILANHRPDDFDAIAATLDRQFRTIHDRAHVLLQICAMLVSATILVTTGKLIVTQITTHLQRVVGYLLVAAGALVITAAGVIVGGVLSIRWTTQHPGDDLGAWLMAVLRYRDGKTVAYRVSIALVLASVLAFQSAIAIALVQI